MDNMEKRGFKIGTIVRHFKGGLYKIVGKAEHTETKESLVIYEQLYAPFNTYARPEEMFCSPTEMDKYPNAKQRWRMEKWNGDVNTIKNGYQPD